MTLYRTREDTPALTQWPRSSSSPGRPRLTNSVDSAPAGHIRRSSTGLGPGSLAEEGLLHGRRVHQNTAPAAEQRGLTQTRKMNAISRAGPFPPELAFPEDEVGCWGARPAGGEGAAEGSLGRAAEEPLARESAGGANGGARGGRKLSLLERIQALELAAAEGATSSRHQTPPLAVSHADMAAGPRRLRKQQSGSAERPAGQPRIQRHRTTTSFSVPPAAIQWGEHLPLPGDNLWDLSPSPAEHKARGPLSKATWQKAKSWLQRSPLGSGGGSGEQRGAGGSMSSPIAKSDGTLGLSLGTRKPKLRPSAGSGGLSRGGPLFSSPIAASEGALGMSLFTHRRHRSSATQDRASLEQELGLTVLTPEFQGEFGPPFFPPSAAGALSSPLSSSLSPGSTATTPTDKKPLFCPSSRVFLESVNNSKW